MNKVTIAFIICIVLTILLYLGQKYLERRYTIKMMKAILEDEQKFMELCDSFVVKMVFHPFNREYMRLNCYIAHASDKKVKEQVSLIEKMRVNTKQLYQTYQTAFQYFISTNKESSAKNMQRKLNAFIDENRIDPSAKTAIEMDIKMYFDKDLNTLPYIDEKLEDCTDAETAVWNFRKAFILKYNGKLDEAKKCMEIVVKYTTEPTQKKEMQRLLDNDLKDL